MTDSDTPRVRTIKCQPPCAHCSPKLDTDEALRAGVRAVLDQMAAQAAVHESRRLEQYGPSAPLQRAYGRGIEYAVDRVRAILDRGSQVKP